MDQGSTMATPLALQSSVLTREMTYPLEIDLSSLGFQHRLGQLLSRYMSVCKFLLAVVYDFEFQ
jgi:hypothetical protein